MRRKKQDVIKHLSEKIENNIYIDLSSKEMNLYAAEVKKARKRMEELTLEVGYSKVAIDLIRMELDKNKITNYTIDGSVPSKKRIELVNNFNNDDTNVFLITLKAGETDLNLTSADVVIHLDLLLKEQLKKILELQSKKKILNDKLIESDDLDSKLFMSLTEEDIRNLLSSENNED